MAEINQNFSMYQGETKNIVVPITKDDGSNVDLTAAVLNWSVRQREYSTTTVLVKESPDITVEGNTLTIHLKPPDTETLLGTYYHKCEIVDQQANDSVLFTGFVTVKV
ncbi:hypothetical protein ACT8ZR_09335 [Neobacillus sp. M.A.Huq-85]